MSVDASNPAPQVETAPPANPAFHKPPAGPGEGGRQQQQQAPSMPTMISLPLDEYNHYRESVSQLTKIRDEQKAAFDAKEAEANQALAKAGQIEEAFANERKRWSEKEAEALHKYKELETQVFNEKIGAVLYEATSNKQFASDHAAQSLRQLLRDQLEARREADGSIKVYEKGGHRPAADMLNERLSDPSLAYFFAPTTRGGSGSDGARHSAPPQQQHQPGSLEAIAEAWRAGQKGGFGLDRTG